MFDWRFVVEASLVFDTNQWGILQGIIYYQAMITGVGEVGFKQIRGKKNELPFFLFYFRLNLKPVRLMDNTVGFRYYRDLRSLDSESLRLLGPVSHSEACVTKTIQSGLEYI